MSDEPKARLSPRQLWLSLSTILFLIGVVYLAVHQRPFPRAAGLDQPGGEFSSARALVHLRQVAKTPHPIGTIENEDVSSYIQQQVSALGLQPEVQEATLTYPRSNAYQVVHVRNIIVRKEGYNNTKAVLLIGHYDTVVASPGAGDDGTAIVCLLETMRALQSTPQLRDHVIFLFTDGEEIGLAGSRAFLKEHPWAKDVGVILNFEARGTSGPSLMFETINGDGWLVNEFTKAAPHPYGNSLLPTIYSFLSHDTDLSSFRGTRIPGMNFAFAESWPNYHTGRDSLEMIDERSVQHQGEYALALTRRLADMDLTNPPKGNAVYFNLIVNTVVHYPTSVAWLLSALALIALVATIIVGFRKRRLSISGLLVGFVALLAAVIISELVIMGCLWFTGKLISSGTAFFESGYYYTGLACLALTVTTLLYGWLSRRTRTENLYAGELLWWGLLTLASTVFVPGATYLFVWPLLIGLGLTLFWFLTPPAQEPGQEPGVARIAVRWLVALPIILLLVPVIHLLFIAVEGPMGFVVSVIIVLTAGLLLPVYQLIFRPHIVWLPALLGLAAVVLLSVAVHRAKPGPAYPNINQVFYVQNLDQGEAIWATLDNKEDVWTSQFFQKQGTVIRLSKFMPDLLYPRANIFQRVAPKVDLAPPTVNVLEDSTADNLHRLKIHLASPMQNPQVSIFIESATELVNAELNGLRLGDDRSPTPVSNSPANDGSAAEPKLRMSVRCYGLAKDGETLLLETRAGAPVKIHVFERSYHFPAIPGLQVKPRPADFTEFGSLGDGTITYRSFTF